MNPEMKIIREVNVQAEDFYNDACRIGDHAATALGAKHRSQLTSLENIADSALKTSDVFDYIKKQTARTQDWRRPPQGQNNAPGFGESLKSYLETELRNRLETVSQKLGIGNTTDEQKQERRRVYLLLIRQFVRQMTVQYEYQVSQGQNTRRREQ